MARRIDIPNVTRADDKWRAYPEALRIIGVDTKHKKGEHPLYDERVHQPLNPEILANYREYGRKDPIKVKMTREDGKTFLDVTDGRRGTLYLRSVNKELEKKGLPKKMLEFIFVKDEDDRDLAILTFLHNEVREDDDFATKAAKAQRLHKDYNLGPEEIARVAGKSVQTARSWLAYNQLAPELKEAVSRNEADGSAVAALANKPPEEQVRQFERAKENAKKNGKSRPSVRDVRTANREFHAPAPKLVREIGEYLAEHADAEYVSVGEILRWFAGNGPEPEVITKIREEMAAVKEQKAGQAQETDAA